MHNYTFLAVHNVFIGARITRIIGVQNIDLDGVVNSTVHTFHRLISIFKTIYAPLFIFFHRIYAHFIHIINKAYNNNILSI